MSGPPGRQGHVPFFTALMILFVMAFGLGTTIDPKPCNERQQVIEYAMNLVLTM